MNRKDIFERLGRVIEASSADDVDWSAVSEDTALETFGLDSLAVLDLIFDLEQELNVEIPAPKMLEMKTTGDLVTFLERQLS